MPTPIVLVPALALYLFVAYVLIATTSDQDMPGGGTPALVIRSLLWPLAVPILVLGIIFG